MQMVALELFSMFNCFPVFLGPDLKERYYRGTCHTLQYIWFLLTVLTAPVHT